ncbi:MAG TPA: SDR family oxidoreductase [Anaerolineaceae bacterium]
MNLAGKTILITGGARRVGSYLAVSLAKRGAKIILHHANSPQEAERVTEEIRSQGGYCQVHQADFSHPEEAIRLFDQVAEQHRLYALINNAAIFEPLSLADTSLDAWNRHLNINLTAPFLLSQRFAAHIGKDNPGRILNILDWRVFRPSADHLPYITSKSALASLTRSLALELAPHITVNGLALGAILPPSDGSPTPNIEHSVPARRWANLDEVAELVVFLLEGATYITGEIINLDGGRHLV